MREDQEPHRLAGLNSISLLQELQDSSMGSSSGKGRGKEFNSDSFRNDFPTYKLDQNTVVDTSMKWEGCQSFAPPPPPQRPLRSRGIITAAVAGMNGAAPDNRSKRRDSPEQTGGGRTGTKL